MKNTTTSTVSNSIPNWIYFTIGVLFSLLCVSPFEGFAQSSKEGREEDQKAAFSCVSCTLLTEASAVYSMLDQRFLIVGAPNLSRPEWGWRVSMGLQYEIRRNPRFSVSHHISYLERPWNNILLVAPVETDGPLPDVISNVEIIINAFHGRPFTSENGRQEIFPLHREVSLESRGLFKLLQGKQVNLDIYAGFFSLIRVARYHDWSPANLGDDIGTRFGFDEVFYKEGKQFSYRTPEFARVGLGVNSGLICTRQIGTKSSISLSSSYNRQVKSIYKQNVAGPTDKRKGQPVWHDLRVMIGYQMKLGRTD